MSTARSFLSATVLGCIFLISCASTKAVVDPEVHSASPPVADPASDKPTGPPPGHVEPKNYVVREKLVLGEVITAIDREVPADSEVSTPPEPAPPVAATQKKVVKKGKKANKTAKKVV
jgi:hypothetical protein